MATALTLSSTDDIIISSRICNTRIESRLRKHILDRYRVFVGGFLFEDRMQITEQKREYQREYQRKYRAEHPEKVKEYQRKYYTEHLEKKKEQRCKYRSSHSVELRERKNKYYIEHREEILERAKEPNKIYRETHREERKELSRIYYIEHAKELGEKSKIRYEKRGIEINRKLWMRYHLKSDYGISVEEYNKMFAEQNGSCAICGKNQDVLKRMLCVDHNHETNKIRGLLCDKCNRGIGFLEDNIELLRKAVLYLEKECQ